MQIWLIRTRCFQTSICSPLLFGSLFNCLFCIPRLSPHGIYFRLFLSFHARCANCPYHFLVTPSLQLFYQEECDTSVFIYFFYSFLIVILHSPFLMPEKERTQFFSKTISRIASVSHHKLQFLPYLLLKIPLTTCSQAFPGVSS